MSMVSLDKSRLLVEAVGVLLGKKNKDKSDKDKKYGAMWLIGGVIVSGVSYIYASTWGGSFVITLGPLIYGGYRLYRGFVSS